ncbi:hypothetical protein LU632_26175 (plasmid) [Erwinia tracheiphila]|uniref:hypothetical protein n=1 Tax=Erwinia tracheiphila TaxID=65700 RepID=UPI001F231F3C|nr:hypothetical protein [Erwinia tracheiphila]UIA94526.1 hypothetical protein LU632_26175 [Erwinia tracheiphila]
MRGGGFDDNDSVKAPVAMAETHAEPARRTVMVVPFYNTNQNSWRFPDGEIVYRLLDAEKKAKSLGMVLEERRKWRFSDSH